MISIKLPFVQILCKYLNEKLFLPKTKRVLKEDEYSLLKKLLFKNYSSLHLKSL